MPFTDADLAERRAMRDRFERAWAAIQYETGDTGGLAEQQALARQAALGVRQALAGGATVLDEAGVRQLIAMQKTAATPQAPARREGDLTDTTPYTEAEMIAFRRSQAIYAAGGVIGVAGPSE